MARIVPVYAIQESTTHAGRDKEATPVQPASPVVTQGAAVTRSQAALGRGGGGPPGGERAQEVLGGERGACHALWGLCVVWSCRRSAGQFVCR
jgi:hypothetical protein